jgi:hypothetical protein
MSYSDYELLVLKAQRPWYRQGVNGKGTFTDADPIIIPRHQLSGALV